MIKRYCDQCDRELTADAAFGGRAHLLTATVKNKAGKVLQVEVLTAKDATWNDGDFCRYCILDALASLDDRPKAEGRKP